MRSGFVKGVSQGLATNGFSAIATGLLARPTSPIGERQRIPACGWVARTSERGSAGVERCHTGVCIVFTQPRIKDID